MPEVQTPSVATGEPAYSEVRQMTVKEDGQAFAINELLADGWRIIHIGQQSDATVYVLGRMKEKPKHRAGFLATD